MPNLPAVRVGPVACGRCRHPMTADLETYVMEPVLIGVGYGEATRITYRRCVVCGAADVVARTSERPFLAGARPRPRLVR